MHCNTLTFHRDFIFTSCNWSNYPPSKHVLKSIWTNIFNWDYLLWLQHFGTIPYNPNFIANMFCLVNFISSFSKYLDSFILFVATTSSCPNGKSFFLVCHWEINTNSYLIDFDTFNLLIALNIWILSPFNSLILIVGFIPSALSFCAKSALINVPWPGQSNTVYLCIYYP